MTVQPDALEPVSGGLNLREILKKVRRFWVGELLVLLATIAIVSLYTAAQPRVYQSTATGITQAASGESLSMAFAGESLAKSKTESYVQIAQSDAVAKRAAETLGDGQSPSSLLSRISANLPSDTAIIQITAKADTPEGAAKLANVWMQALSDQVKELETPEGSIGSAALTFLPLASARPPYLPSSPNLQIYLAIAALSGLVLALGYGLIRSYFDRRVRTVEQIESLLGVPVIGTVPESEALAERRRIVSEGANIESEELFAIAESLRELRTNLSYIDIDNPPRVIVMTSTIPGEGKSTLSSNLADAIAASERNVVIIDCDLRRPTQSILYGLRGGAGLTDVLSGRVALNDALQAPSNDPHLRVLASGRVPPNPSELLGSRTMKDLISAIGDVATVILDAPPLLSVTDAAIMSTIADGVVITVGAKQPTAEQLATAYRSVTRVNGKVLGVVLNRIPRSGADAKGYGNYRSNYYYRSEETEDTTGPTESGTGPTTAEDTSSTSSKQDQNVEQVTSTEHLTNTGPKEIVNAGAPGQQPALRRRRAK